MSQDPQADGLTAEEFSRLTAEINSTVRKYPENCQPEERALLESLEQLFTEQQGMLNPVLSWSREERHRQAWRFLNEEVLPQRSRIQETSEKIALWNSQQLGATDREMFRSFASLQARQTRLLAIALTAGLVLSLASIVYLLRLGEEAQRRYQELAAEPQPSSKPCRHSSSMPRKPSGGRSPVNFMMRSDSPWGLCWWRSED